MQRIGVFVCWCGSNIAATVDVETRLAGSFKGTRRCFLHKLSVYVFPDRAADDSGENP